MVKKKQGGAAERRQEEAPAASGAMTEDMARMIAAVSAQTIAAAMQQFREQDRSGRHEPQMHQEPLPLRGQPTAVRAAPVGGPIGARGPLRQEGSRYTEPGVRGRKRMQSEEKTKVWSAFLEYDTVQRFRATCKDRGVTQRAGAEEAFEDWIGKKPTRDVSWKK